MTATSLGFRLSSQQERIWSQQSGEHEALWLSYCEVFLDGSVDPMRLRAAIADVVKSHEILQTVFRRQPGLKIPFQVIENDIGFVWQARDLTGMGEEAAMSHIRQLADESLDPEDGPLFNAIFATLGPGRSVLAIGLPALCADHLSLTNLIVAIARRYAPDGSEANADVLQYADIAEWQEDLRTSEETRAGREYWRGYCRKLDFTPLPFPGASQSTTLHSFAPAVVFGQVLSSFEHATREFVLSCWQVFLARTVGKSKLLIGCEPGVRKYDDLREAIGPLATYLPLQFGLDLEIPFASLVEQTAAALYEAERWQESFAWSQLDHSAGSTPALSAAFEYADLPPAISSGSVQFTIVRTSACSDLFALKLAARRQADALYFELHYDASKVDAATVQDWSHQIETLLTAAAADPGIPLWRLPLLDAPARRRVLQGWNETESEYPREATIHELFERQAALTPDRAAVCCEQTSLSYRELNERSNQVAHALRKAGAGPEIPVGLCVERGAGMIAGLLGILKAGAGYVPLSPDQPRLRLARQLEGVSLLLMERKFLPQLPEFTGRMIDMDWSNAELADEPESNPEPSAGPENLAYVIFTSGSTGIPKGVAVRHRNLVNYSWFLTRKLALERYPDGLVFATVSTLAADLGNTCVFPSLISGGCLRVIPSDAAADSQRFGESNARYPIDVLKIVPSHLAALLDAGGGKAVLPAKFLILGGEAFTARLLEQVRAQQPDCEILNHYGPTETTVGSLTFPLSEFSPGGPTGETVPIGRPIANTRVYILDSHREPVPPGVAGELYIAGDGVSAGYLNRPDATGERFLPDLFAAKGKMYRTGDLARYLPDGNVEFLGRADNQVKIRGFRVELGELDAALGSHGGVSQAVTVARTNERGEARLIAYVTPQRGQTLAVDALREYLRGLLPDYMMPAAVVILPKLPLTANGKIDRENLPEPESIPKGIGSYVAPQTPTEHVVAGIWAEVLRRDKVGTEDNFFDIGGHSLLATQVISRMRRSLEIDPPLRLLFESPTVGKLAAWIDDAVRNGQGLRLPPITRVRRDQPLPLSFAQQRLWVIDQLDSRNPLYNVPRALRIKGPLDEDALRRSLNEILRRHESQRTTFRTCGGSPVQVVADSMAIALNVCDLTHLPSPEVEGEARRLAGEEALRPFDLENGPLVRAELLRLAPDDHVFLLTAHHIVSDAWSAGIFLKELGTLYADFSDSRPSSLPEVTMQYADFAAWQRQWLQGETLNRQVEYWREHLKGAPPVLELPANRPREQAVSHRGSAELVWHSPALSQELKAFSRREDVTPFMTLLAVFQVLLSRYSGQEQIVVGTDVANRTALESESMVGFFVNLLAVRSDLSGDPAFRELLRRVRTVALGAYAHQDMPFDKLVEDLQPDRKASHNPLVQVLFVMQNTPAPPRALGGLQLSGFDMPVTHSKFDLAVFMVERENRLGGYWVYRTDLFEAETIRRWAGEFDSLLQNAILRPEARLSAIETRNEEEKRKSDGEKNEHRESHRAKLMAARPEALAVSDQTGTGERR